MTEENEMPGFDSRKPAQFGSAFFMVRWNQRESETSLIRKTPFCKVNEGSPYQLHPQARNSETEHTHVALGPSSGPKLH